MFLGHFAVGFASKRIAPRASLGMLLAARVALPLGLFAGSVAEPPPSARAVALVGLSAWLLPLSGAWIDRHRGLRATGRAWKGP
jgi:hypothetical protein